MSRPSISIITPCLNVAQYIRATVDSVLSQEYQQLEYWVVDGGSSDGTLEVLREYGGGIRVLSEPDDGQSDAINKGLRRSSGEIVSWLNASDCYQPGALAVVAGYAEAHPEAGLIFGRARYMSGDGLLQGEYEVRPAEEMQALNAVPGGHRKMLLSRRLGWIPQPSAFWRRSAMKSAGLLDASLHYAMDYEYWLRLGAVAPIHFVDAPLGAFRLHSDAKSAHAWRQWKEVLLVNRRYRGPWGSAIHRAFLRACLTAAATRLGGAQGRA